MPWQPSNRWLGTTGQSFSNENSLKGNRWYWDSFFREKNTAGNCRTRIGYFRGKAIKDDERNGQNWSKQRAHLNQAWTYRIFGKIRVSSKSNLRIYDIPINIRIEISPSSGALSRTVLNWRHARASQSDHHSSTIGSLISMISHIP